MENKNTKRIFSPLVITIVCILIIALGVATFILIYTYVADSNKPTTDENHVSTIVSRVYTTSDDFLAHIEDIVGIDIPDGYTTYRSSTALDTFSFEINKYHNTIDYFTCVFFNNATDEELSEIEEIIAQDKRFKSSLGDMKKIVDVNGGEVLDEYKLVYIMDTSEFNTLPDKAGEYRIITIFYDTDLHCFSIEEYNNNYYKTVYPTE